MSKTYTVRLEKDDESEDLILPLPNELLEEMGWKVGDDLEWLDNKNGTFSLAKKED